jgi:hypothetical protein
MRIASSSNRAVTRTVRPSPFVDGEAVVGCERGWLKRAKRD